jgi:hypothetical protein
VAKEPRVLISFIYILSAKIDRLLRSLCVVWSEFYAMVQLSEATRSDLLLNLLSRAVRHHGPAVFRCGHSAEDAVIAHAIISADLDIEILRIEDEGSLEDALAGKKAWISGARGTADGSAVPLYEYDARHGVLRFNPLAEWRDEHIAEYIQGNALGKADQYPTACPSVRRSEAAQYPSSIL